MSEIGPICKTPLAQENYNTIMHGIDKDKKIQEEGEKYRKELQDWQK